LSHLIREYSLLSTINERKWKRRRQGDKKITGEEKHKMKIENYVQ